MSLQSRMSPQRPWPERAAQLFALVNLALAGPLLDLLARQPTFFVAHRLGQWDAVAISVMISFGIPLLLLGIERLVGSSFAGRLHIGLAALLAAALGSRIALAQSFGRLAIPLAILFGALAVGMLRHRAGRVFLIVLAPLAVAIPAMFWRSEGVTSLGSPPPLAAVPEITAPQTVVMIVFDELPLTTLLRPSGKINGERFPTFAYLASRATWYPNAITVAQFTNQAVPAILTGRYPRHTLQPTVADHPRNLFTVLGSSMPVRAVEIATALCPTDLCPPQRGIERLLAPTLLSDLGIVLGHLVLPHAIARSLPTIEQAWAGFANAGKKRGHLARELVQQVDDFLELIAIDAAVPMKRRPPSFYFLHLLLPHTPWRFLPSGARYPPLAPPGQTTVGTWDDDPWLTRQARRRHVLQAAFADQLLDQILFRLRKTRTFHRSLIIVASDHGHAFLPGSPARKVTDATASEILPVPLFVKYPKQSTGEVDERMAETTDIVATVFDTLGVARNVWQTDGVSLREEPAPDRPKTTVFLRSTDTPGQPRTFTADRDLIATSRLESGRRLRRELGITVDDLDRLVPLPSLRPYLDQPLSSLPNVETRLEVRLREPQALLTVEPDDETVPLLVDGKVSGGVINRQIYVAVAVDGIIRAFTRTAVSERRKWRPFQALLPESCMTPGEHQVEAVALNARW